MREKVARLANPKYWHVCGNCSDGEYRYGLHRPIDASSDKGTVMFIMLNPSKAHETDETQNDPTIKRCKGFAKRWGYGQLVVVNLSPLRATKPKKLRELKAAGFEPSCVRKANLSILKRGAAMADKIVLAWGANGTWDIRVKRALQPYVDKVYCLGTTKKGHPRHPLPVPYSQKPRLFRGTWGHESNA